MPAHSGPKGASHGSGGFSTRTENGTAIESGSRRSAFKPAAFLGAGSYRTDSAAGTPKRKQPHRAETRYARGDLWARAFDVALLVKDWTQVYLRCETGRRIGNLHCVGFADDRMHQSVLFRYLWRQTQRSSCSKISGLGVRVWVEECLASADRSRSELRPLDPTTVLIWRHQALGLDRILKFCAMCCRACLLRRLSRCIVVEDSKQASREHRR